METLGSSHYTCQLEYGEQVPLQVTVLKPNAMAWAYESEPGEVPPELRSSLSLWNQDVLKISQKSQVKRRASKDGNQRIFFDTRYLKLKGPSFKLTINCDQFKSQGRCDGSFDGNKKELIFHHPQLFDRREPEAKGHVTIGLTKRKHFGLIVRVFKSHVPTWSQEGKKSSLPISSSGEMKVFSEEKLLSMDVGADEQLFLTKTTTQRIAGLEIKLNCLK